MQRHANSLPLLTPIPPQELRKQTAPNNLPCSDTQSTVIQSDYGGFAIYTDENSGGGTTTSTHPKDNDHHHRQFSTSAGENSENFPPTKSLSHGLLPSVVAGESAIPFGPFHATATAETVPIQGKAQLEDKNR